MDVSMLKAINWDFVGAKTNGLTHSLHPYPAKYIPQIPSALIHELSNEGETVADIFCGSGTTLIEAILQQRNTIGIDANPLACLISEAKTARITTDDAFLLRQIAMRAQTLAVSIANTELPFQSKAFRPSNNAIIFWFEPFVVEELAEILSWCNAINSEAANKIALAAFSSIVVAVSKQDSDTRYVRREKNIKPGDTARRFAKTLVKSTQSVVELAELTNKKIFCKIYHKDILSKPDIGIFDLMVCSPPYPNAYSYHLYHMTRMIWLGMDYLIFKQQEIGSHRKYSKAKASIEPFKVEMSEIFEWLYNHLRPGRFACFVIGDSTIKGQRINNADLLANIARDKGFQEMARIPRTMQATKKTFNPAIGKIKEEKILVLEREG